MKGRPKIERVDLFGDTRKIAFDTERKQFLGVGRVSPTDVSRLLEKLAEHYGPAKTKRGKRIAELSTELAKLVKTDCDFYADTYSFIAGGLMMLLNTDQQVIKMKPEY
jgi:hypothetical protein